MSDDDVMVGPDDEWFKKALAEETERWKDLLDLLKERGD